MLVLLFIFFFLFSGVCHGELTGKKLDRALREYHAFSSRILTDRQYQPTAEELELLRRLAAQNYAPAAYTLGEWLLTGTHVAKDEKAGLALLQKAIDHSYAPALLLRGQLEMDGQVVKKDEADALQWITSAAVLGDPRAQLLLGQKFEAGDGVVQDLARARRYYRLCAWLAPVCQFRMGRLLLSAPDRTESKYLEALALLELASERHYPQAEQLLAPELPRLNDEQKRWILRLKERIQRVH